ncbi:MAG: glycosyltransferase [Phycisphaerales bacterium]|nr:glycosyltransferase [Phycisphaerales bacterium]
MRISLITPSFNHARFIGRTIDSVLSQRGDFELDYRILDGASTDGTLDILRSYGDRVTFVSAPDDGQVDAINRGLKSAEGDVVGWLNSDDVLKPGALQRVATAFREHPQCDWLHGDCDVIDADDREIRRWVSAYKRFFAKRYSYRSLLRRNFISQMTVFWRRRLMDEVGVLDPGLKLAFDYELWLRFAQRSSPLYIPERLASFRWYETSKSGANFSRQFIEDELIARRHGVRSPGARLVKRVNNVLTVAIYNALALARRLRPGRS